MIWKVYRRNGEYVLSVEAPDYASALSAAWRRYFGDPNGRLSPKDDGTLQIIPA